MTSNGIAIEKTAHLNRMAQLETFEETVGVQWTRQLGFGVMTIAMYTKTILHEVSYHMNDDHR